MEKKLVHGLKSERWEVKAEKLKVRSGIRDPSVFTCPF